MNRVSSKIIFFALLALVQYSAQQAWKNDKIVKQWDPNLYNYEPVQNQAQLKGEFFQNFGNVPANQPNAPVPQPPLPQAQAPVVQNQPLPGSPPSGPFPIQQQTITNSGETIIENLIGGIQFDCSTRPTGHWRDGKFCDLFHACVFGQQRKTYVCPIVGERTYFDEVTKRCEFLNQNPHGCTSNVFYL